MRNSLRGALVNAPSWIYCKLYVSVSWCISLFLNPLFCRLTNGPVLSSLLPCERGPVVAVVGCEIRAQVRLSTAPSQTYWKLYVSTTWMACKSLTAISDRQRTVFCNLLWVGGQRTVFCNLLWLGGWTLIFLIAFLFRVHVFFFIACFRCRARHYQHECRDVALEGVELAWRLERRCAPSRTYWKLYVSMTWCISLFLNPLFCRLNNGFVLVVVGVLSRTSGCHTWMRKSLGGAFQRHVLDLLEIVRSHDMVYLIALESFVLQAHHWTCFGFSLLACDCGPVVAIMGCEIRAV